MKTRFERLWAETMPAEAECPQPTPDAVLDRVDGSLGGRKHRTARRAVKLSVILAASLALLTGIALAAGQSALPEGNVLESFFYRGENPEMAASLVQSEPITVSDENYTMTVTSSIADKKEVYFTLTVQPKTDTAREFLQTASAAESPDEPSLLEQFRIKVGVWGATSGAMGGGYREETETLELSVSQSLPPILSGHVSIRFEPMAEGLWLKLPVHPISAVRLRIQADGQGCGTMGHASGGPVTLEKLELSPMTVWMQYSSPKADSGMPLLYFLWKDGTIRTMGQMQMTGPSGSGTIDEIMHFKETWKFGAIQDLTQMEAVLFGNMAYPLDGRAPYEMDTSALPQPFALPRPESLPGSDSPDNPVPLFALCEGLQIPCQWDEASQTLTAEFRGVSITCTAGSRFLTSEPGDPEPYEMDSEAVLLDGELWAYAAPLLQTEWQIRLSYAYENSRMDNDTPRWAVIP